MTPWESVGATVVVGAAIALLVDAGALPFAVWCVRNWARLCTAGVVDDVKQRRRAEILSDVAEQVRRGHDLGYPPKATGVHMCFRLCLGIPSDISWRFERAGADGPSDLLMRVLRAALVTPHALVLLAVGPFFILAVLIRTILEGIPRFHRAFDPLRARWLVREGRAKAVALQLGMLFLKAVYEVLAMPLWAVYVIVSGPPGAIVLLWKDAIQPDGIGPTFRFADYVLRGTADAILEIERRAAAKAGRHVESML